MIKNPKNKVLQDGFRKSKNFFESDLMLRHYCDKYFSKAGKEYLTPKLEYLGKAAAQEMDRLSLLADKNPPKLIYRNSLGENVNKIEFHPAYEELKKIAVKSELFRVKWEPANKIKFRTERHSLGFSLGLLFTMSEAGLFCPLCMTDGAARIIDRFASPEDKKRLLPRIATNKVEDLFTGAMFLTEKIGGSDVGANLVRAKQFEEDKYLLEGEKWFCSNANAEIILALARTDENVKGTKGLSLFLIEKLLPNGEINPKQMVRLKEKLGVRSMASAEILLGNTEGKRIGEEFQGFAIMSEMINLSRLYNAVTSCGIMRRALVESWEYLNFRRAFGRPILEHALVRDKLAELASLQIANFYLCWRTIRALDAADNGNKESAISLRFLTPMLKKFSAEDVVYITREAMEAVGGNAYIEESVMPKLHRDALVLPIWEGAGNIMILDMLRVLLKLNAEKALFTELKAGLQKGNEAALLIKADEIQAALEDIKQEANFDKQSLMAKRVFAQFCRLYQISLLHLESEDKNTPWMIPAITHLKASFFGFLHPHHTAKDLTQLMAWSF